MKKLPKSITILGRIIPIKCLPGDKIKELYPQFEHTPQGLWDSADRVIVLNNQYPLKDQFYTLLHECFHSSFTTTGLDLILNADLQEILVQTCASVAEDLLSQQRTLK